MHQRSKLKKSDYGQSALLFGLIGMVLFFMLFNAGRSWMHQNATQQVVLERRHLQAYFAAKGGINEAIGSRMIPRSNILNFTAPANAMYGLSGVLRQNPSNRSSPVMALYRYIILGGDEGRSATTGGYSSNPMQFVDPTQYQQKYYIISQGSSCIDNASHQTVPGISYQGVHVSPNQWCPNPSTQSRLDVTLMTSADLTRQTNLTADVVSDFTMVPDPTNVTLPGGVQVQLPGSTTTTNQFNFDTVWSTLAPPIPAYVVVQNILSFQNPQGSSLTCTNPRSFTQKCLYGQAITGTNTTITSGNYTVNPGDIIRIYFNEPVDYRSYYIGLTDTSGNPSQVSEFSTLLPRCESDITQCNITLSPLSGTLPGLLIPTLPSDSSVAIYPPAAISSQMPNGVYTLTINNISAFSGGELTTPYTIHFTVSSS